MPEWLVGALAMVCLVLLAANRRWRVAARRWVRAERRRLSAVVFAPRNDENDW